MEHYEVITTFKKSWIFTTQSRSNFLIDKISCFYTRQCVMKVFTQTRKPWLWFLVFPLLILIFDSFFPCAPQSQYWKQIQNILPPKSLAKVKTKRNLTPVQLNEPSTHPHAFKMCTTTQWHWKACGHTITTEYIILCKELFTPQGCINETPGILEKKGRCPDCRTHRAMQNNQVVVDIEDGDGGWEMVTELMMKEIRQV